MEIYKNKLKLEDKVDECIMKKIFGICSCKLFWHFMKFIDRKIIR